MLSRLLLCLRLQTLLDDLCENSKLKRLLSRWCVCLSDLGVWRWSHALVQTENALHRLRALLDQPEPKLIRVGVRNKGCAGMSYHLEYVDKPGKFDEVVLQDGVRVLIDSKALFSIIGSEMDWVEDRLSARFQFKSMSASILSDLY